MTNSYIFDGESFDNNELVFEVSNSQNVSTQNNTTPSNSTQQQTSNVNLMSENNNMMQINNIDATYAQQIQQQAPQIAPDVYMQQQAQIAAQQMT